MAFRIKYRYYKYTVMPFELINIFMIMQCLVNNIFQKYLDRFCVVYLDNIFIFSDNKKEYKEYIIKIRQT